MSNSSRFFIIGVITLIASYVTFFPFVADTWFGRLPVVSSLKPPPYKLGMDLKGGTVLTFRIKDGSESMLEELSGRLKKRLDPTGVKGYSIRGVGTEFIRIAIPDVEAGDEEIELVKRLVTTVGDLKFRIVADRNNKTHKRLIEEAELFWPKDGEEAPSGDKVSRPRAFSVSADDVTKPDERAELIPYGKWIPIFAGDPDEELLTLAEEAANSDRRKVEDNIWFRPLSSFSEETSRDGDRLLFRVPRPGTRGDFDEKEAVTTIIDGEMLVLARWTDNEDGDDKLDFNFGPNHFTVQSDEDGEHYVLVYVDSYDVGGRYIKDAYPSFQDLQQCLVFQLDNEGGRLFGELTTEFQPDKDGQLTYLLGVMLDGRLRSAPNLQEPITGGSGRITGSFSRAEIDRLERVFRAGQLSAVIDPNADEKGTGPSLGEETIRRGVLSMAFALGGVIVFMILYYRAAGVVAVLALCLNVLLTVAGMVAIGQNWTLNALAALVLTIGMAVDANVLIYERIREELDLGRPLLMALRAGFEKAWGTILDSNLTTILTGVILFAVGSEEMKGFAVTLIIGLLCSMFTAVFVTRTIFNTLVQARWLRKLSMARILTKPNYRFVAWARPVILASAIFIAVGMLAVGFRGKQLLGTDLVGGTDAALRFKEPIKIDVVRDMLSEDNSILHPTVQELDLSRQGVADETRYLVQTESIDTAETPNDQTVRARLARAFPDLLEVQTVQAGEATEAPPAKTGDPPRQRVTLTVSPPRKLNDLQLELASAIEASMPDVENPRQLFELEAPPLPEDRTRDDWESKVQHTEFFLIADPSLDVKSLVASISGTPLFDQYGGTPAAMARDAQIWAITAIILSWLGIVAYVWFRFGSWTFGVGGVVALVHDVLVALSCLAMVSILAVQFPEISVLQLTEMRIDLNVIAALMTLIGYSINDTIVIFDRVRELRGKSPRVTAEIVDRALNGTLSRTVITALIVFVTVFVLFLFGGEGIHPFAFVLVVGTISGTYSTIYIACPVMLWLEEWRTKGMKRLAPAEAPLASTAP